MLSNFLLPLSRINNFIYDLFLGDYYAGVEADYYNYACMLAKRGRRQQALKYLRQAIEFDPRHAERAKKDRDFQSLWEDEEFKQIVLSARSLKKEISPENKIRRKFFNFAILFTLICVILTFLGYPVALEVLQYALLASVLIQVIYVLIFRNFHLNYIFSLPMFLGYILAFILFVVLGDKDSLDVVINKWILAIVAIYHMASLLIEWSRRDKTLEGYLTYQIQSYAWIVLISFLFLMFLMHGAFLVDAFRNQDCSNCILYYFIQMIYPAVGFLLTGFLSGLRDQYISITLQRAQTVLVYLAFGLLVILLFIPLFWPYIPHDSFLISLLFDTTYVFLALIVSLSEVHLRQDLPSENKVTRFVVPAFFAWILVTNFVVIASMFELFSVLLPGVKNSVIGFISGVNFLGIASLTIDFVSLIGRRETSKGDNHSIIGNTNTPINLNSPFGIALFNLANEGKGELASTLMHLNSIFEVAQFAKDDQKVQAQEILESIADELQKDEPKKFSVQAMLESLVRLVSSAATVSEKAPVLLDNLKEMIG